MKYHDFESAIWKKVKLRTNDGEIFEGILSEPTSGFDTSTGKDSVDVDTGDVCIEIAIDDITEITVIE